MASITYEISFLDILGVFPAVLTLASVLLGVVSIWIRRRVINIAVAHGLAAIACAGIATSAWRIFRTSLPFVPGSGRVVDPVAWISEFGLAWLPIGVVLPGCGIGFAMVALSWLMTLSNCPKEAS